MNKKWIAQFNKKCAEFIGAYFCDDDKKEFPNGYWLIDDYYRELPLYLNQFKFHSDWNWIMEVVEKIESFIFQEPVPDTYYEVRLVGSVYVYIGSNNGDELITVDDQPSKKQAVVKAIDQFIDWYNKQKES